MDAQPLLDYFHKLYEWLQAHNKKRNLVVGWSEDPCKYKRYPKWKLYYYIIDTAFPDATTW